MRTKDVISIPDQLLDLHFPIAGMDQSQSFDRQPQRPLPTGLGIGRTTPLGVNVRSYEPGTGRSRGGSRPGLAKYIPEAVIPAWMVQQLDAIVTTGVSWSAQTVPATFSADESTVTVIYHGATYVIPRPVAPSWNYTPTGNTYYMSTTGSDSNPGSKTQPFATVTHFLSICSAGDCLYILPGDYTEAIRISVSGTAGNPIIISCAPKSAGGGLGTVHFQLPQSVAENGYPGEATDTSVIAVHAANYITINGLILEGALGKGWNPKPSSNPNGLMWENGACTGCQATNNICLNNLHCGMKDQSALTTNLFIQGNVWFSNGRTGLDHGIYMTGNGATIDGNISFANAGWQIHLYSNPANLTVTNNLYFSTGVNEFGGMEAGCNNSLIRHNTGYGNSHWQYGIQANNSTANNTIEDNIFYGSAYLDFFFAGDGLEALMDYNDYITLANTSSPNTPGAHNLHVNPLFRNPVVGDFRLSAGSPLVGAGSGGGNMGCY